MKAKPTPSHTAAEFVAVGDICDLVNGNAYNESTWSTAGVPIIRIQNLNNAGKPFNYWAGELDGRVVVNDGDVLLAWSGTPGTSFGAHRWNRGLGVLNQHIFRVDFDHNRFDPDWMVFAINEQLSHLISKAHGAVGLSHVTRKECDGMRVWMPELSTQRRLAARLKKQMAAVAEARQRVEEQAKAAALLWEETLAEAFAGQSGGTWKVQSLGDLLSSPLRTGISKQGKATSPHRCLGLSAVRHGCLDLSASKPIQLTTAEAERNRIRPGAFYVVRGNGNVRLVGRGAIAPEEMAEAVVFPDLLIEVNPNPAVLDTQYLRWAWDAPTVRKEIEARSMTTSGIFKINLGNLAQVPVPVPPLETQRRLAARLREQFATLRQLQSALNDQLAALAQLPGAYLWEAFGSFGTEGA